MAKRRAGPRAKSPDDYARSMAAFSPRRARRSCCTGWAICSIRNSKPIGVPERFEDALNTVIGIIEANRDEVEGIKIRFWRRRYELTPRSRLPEGVLCFTGDDFNYAPLIEGDGNRRRPRAARHFRCRRTAGFRRYDSIGQWRYPQIPRHHRTDRALIA